MRVTNIVGIVGALLAAGSFLYTLITGDLSIPPRVVLYVGLVGALYWVYFNLEQAVVAARTRSVQQTGLGAFVVIVSLGLFFGANYIASRHTKRYDATDVGLYSLAPQTIKVLTELGAPVRVLAFFPENDEGKKKFQDLVEGYQEHTDKLAVQWVDPDFEPALTQEYGVRVAGTVIVEVGEQKEHVTDVSEEALTNALIAVTRSEKKAVYFVEGDGELSLDGQGERAARRAGEELRKKGFTVESLNLLAEGRIPADARVLVIAGPRSDLLEKEKAALEGWLDAGGHMLLLVDPETPAGFRALAEDRGIQLPEAIVVDMVGQTYVGDATMPVVIPVGMHEITRDMGSDVVILRYARPVKAGTGPHGEQVQTLMGSSQNAWGETDLEAFKVQDPTATEESAAVLRFDEGADVAGPVEVMAISTRSLGEQPDPELEPDAPAPKEAVLAVIGDSDFAGDALFDAKLNGDLLLNTVSFLAQESDLISIRPRTRDNKPFTPSESESALVMYSSLAILPGASLLLGIIMYLRRRRL